MDTNVDAVPSLTLAGQAETLQQVYDLIGMGALARTPGILLANVRNMMRRSDCLSGIEQLFTYEVPDEDDVWETFEECDLNWGQDRAQYVETFKAAIPAFIARHPELAGSEVQAEGVRVDDDQDAALEWYWSTSDEGQMVAAGTNDVTEALWYALYESGIATFGEDQTNIFLCRFRPARIDWKGFAKGLLEQIDNSLFDHTPEDSNATEDTDVDALAAMLEDSVTVNANVAYDECEFAPGDGKYETALLCVRNDDASAKRNAAPAASSRDLEVGS